MPDSSKRKGGLGGQHDDRNVKRSKGGTAGKWQTPHQRAKGAASGGLGPRGKIEPGDMGIWVTCVKGKEGAATEEVKALFIEHAEALYPSFLNSSAPEPPSTSSRSPSPDIESAITSELASLSARDGAAGLFSPIYLDLQCVLFFKTRAPVEPVPFVQSLCVEARDHPEKRRGVRFVNRLTPMMGIGRAAEKGLVEVGRRVLGTAFGLNGELKREEGVEKEKGDGEEEEDGGEESGREEAVEGKAYSYAIRPTFRNHKNLKRDFVIDLIASLIHPRHNVNLTKPDKVIIVDIYQTICGMSVVDGPDWDALKRYNLAEIHHPTPKPVAAVVQSISKKMEEQPQQQEDAKQGTTSTTMATAPAMAEKGTQAMLDGATRDETGGGEADGSG